MTIAALWFPDWPVQAVWLEGRGDGGGQEPDAVAVVHSYRVVACSAQARAQGVRRGMRIRQAQAVCPDMEIMDHNPDRDGAVFSALSESLDDVASSVEVLRPGLAVVDAGAAGRFHGSEHKALEMMMDATARAGVDVQIGAADELATAIIAARQGHGNLVPAGKSPEFLSSCPVSVLAAETALGCPQEFVEQCFRLGIRSLGDLAVLPAAQVTTRFGAPGMLAHRIATAAPDRRVAPELPGTQFAVALRPEDPIERVDAAAFAARQLAAQLHATLAAAGMVCLRLTVAAELVDGTQIERTWRTREALSEHATADRVRWQLDGWLSRAQAHAGEGSAIAELQLIPVEISPPGAAGLWDNGANEEQARRVIARVQSQLGMEKVVAPRSAGGRGVEERIELVPFGEQRDPVPEGSWPGRIPAPLPARLGGGLGHPASRIHVVDRDGTPVKVNAEALLSGEPYAIKWGAHTYLVAGWAGPWPVDERWWEENSLQPRVARMQLVGQAPGEQVQRAWLLQWSAGGWAVEAAYF
ncbi:DNA polymerase [Corynebacterium phocae]|uniref:DNA polymerase n=1 Tax=Corynebacterium phocae TaxID=161895 RepID=A0A1L7D4V7_9CORY|nr:DNA polymerase Y family protein [Corynebacterium phocae]APT93178.1 DNA polymerase [Corynebacterium phocae]KAA8721914.1 DNA polymerase Y family protein [Corynebacterium phocae]